MSKDGNGNRPELVAVEELRKKIHSLLELQRFALDRVTFLGMTQEEAKGVHARRQEIGTLVDQLAVLKKKSLQQCR